MAKLSRKGNKTIVENKQTKVEAAEDNSTTIENDSTFSAGKIITTAVFVVAGTLLALQNCFKKKPDTDNQDNNYYTDDDDRGPDSGGEFQTPKKKPSEEEKVVPANRGIYNELEGSHDGNNGNEEGDHTTPEHTNRYEGITRHSRSPEYQKPAANGSGNKGKGNKSGKKRSSNHDNISDESDYLEMLDNHDNPQDSKIIEYTGYTLGVAGVATIGFAAYSGDLGTLGSTLTQVSGALPNILDSYTTVI